MSHHAETRAARFRRRAYPGVSARQWADWRWQMRHRLRGPADLERHVDLSPGEREALRRAGGRLPVAVTPYYATLMDPCDPAHPIRRTVLPVPAERRRGRGERADPLGERGHSPVPGIVHTYPDKVVLLSTRRTGRLVGITTTSSL